MTTHVNIERLSPRDAPEQHANTNGHHPTVIVSSIPVEDENALLPVSLPPEVMEGRVLEAIIRESADIIQGDISPREKAELIQVKIGQLSQNLQGNLLELGYDLFWAKELGLYQWIGDGYPDMGTWIKAMEVPPNLVRHALYLYQLWAQIRNYGYTVWDLTSGTNPFTEEKAQYLLSQTRDWERQRKQIAESSSKVPPEELRRVEEEKITEIRAKIEQVRTSSDDEVRALRAQRQQGGTTTERVDLFFARCKSNGRDQPLLVGTFYLPYSRESFQAISQGRYTLHFQFEGEDEKLTLGEVLERLDHEDEDEGEEEEDF